MITENKLIHTLNNEPDQELTNLQTKLLQLKKRIENYLHLIYKELQQREADRKSTS